MRCLYHTCLLAQRSIVLRCSWIGAKIARTAGSGVRLVSVDGDEASLNYQAEKLGLLNQTVLQPLGPLEMVVIKRPPLGRQEKQMAGKRPRVRDVPMNPVDHPMGGGEGRTSGGGRPSSPWGQLSKGFPTRKKSKPSNSDSRSKKRASNQMV